MRMKKDHDLTDRLLLGPARGDARCSPWPNARYLLQPIGTRLNDVESGLAESCYDALRHCRPNATHLSGREILFDALSPFGGVALSV